MGSRSAGLSVRAAHRIATTGVVIGILYIALITADTAAGLVTGGDRPVAGDSLELAAQVPPEQLDLPAGYDRVGWIDVVGTVEDPGSGPMLTVWAVQAAGAVLVVVILELLRRMVGAVRAGEPFAERNVARLRTVGSVLLLGVPLVELLEAGLRSASLDWLPPAGVDLGVAGPVLPVGAMLAGVGAHVLAAVFSEGLRLHDDVEATI